MVKISKYNRELYKAKIVRVKMVIRALVDKKLRDPGKKCSMNVTLVVGKKTTENESQGSLSLTGMRRA